MGKKRIIKKSGEELIKETEAVEKEMEKGAKKEIKSAQIVKKGRIYIASSYNNTIISLSDSGGNILAWKSAGSIGFKGAKKATSFAASKVAETVCAIAEKLKIAEVNVYVKGIGSGRESAIRSLVTHGLNITSIKDVTPIPHNGCRPPKVRRV